MTQPNPNTQPNAQLQPGGGTTTEPAIGGPERTPKSRFGNIGEDAGAGGGGSTPSGYDGCMALWDPAKNSREDWYRICQQAGMVGR